jgi:5-methylcytosine-specific restriction endonuclease McrA
MPVSELRLDGVAAPAADARTSADVARPSPAATVQPLAPARYKVQFTASAQLHDKLERLRALMRSKVPDGDLGAIIERAVAEKLARLEARRFARTSRPRKDVAATDTAPSSRRIPAAVRRAVHERDAGRCCYVGGSGRRCTEQDRLEYHHRRPFGQGGNHNPENIGLACRAHNLYLAEHDYGRKAMARHRRPSNAVSSMRADPRGS